MTKRGSCALDNLRHRSRLKKQCNIKSFLFPLKRLQNGTTPKVGEVAEGGELEVSPSYPNPAQQESVEKKKPIECG